ncbi:hypothetical protein [Streptomyces sp. NPDC002644]
MAEISYPFAEDSASGGTKIVSQVQWQNMAHMFSGDFIDFALTQRTYESSAMPFWTTATAANTVTVRPGKAFVGGFYYELTSNKAVVLPTNNTNLPRRDAIVVRADLATGSAIVTYSQGQPATNPLPPAAVKTPGSQWEMILYTVLVGANNGGITVEDRRVFPMPPPATMAWNVQASTELLPYGTLTLDMDVNATGGQSIAFHGHDGFMTMGTLGKRRPWTPDVDTVINKPPTSGRTGWYRWIAPGTVSFSIDITVGAKACTATSDTSAIAFTLPFAANPATRQVFAGVLDNPKEGSNLPNLVHVSARTLENASNRVALWYPGPSNSVNGLNGLKVLPAYSTLNISGVYEAATLY